MLSELSTLFAPSGRPISQFLLDIAAHLDTIGVAVPDARFAGVVGDDPIELNIAFGNNSLGWEAIVTKRGLDSVSVQITYIKPFAWVVRADHKDIAGVVRRIARVADALCQLVVVEQNNIGLHIDRAVAIYQDLLGMKINPAHFRDVADSSGVVTLSDAKERMLEMLGIETTESTDSAKPPEQTGRNQLLVEVQELAAALEADASCNHALLKLYEFACVMDTLGIPYTDCRLAKSQSGVILALYNTNLGWKASVRVTEDTSVWELKLNVRSSSRTQYTRLDGSIFNQMSERGAQCLRTVASIARLHHTLVALHTAFARVHDTDLYIKVLKVFSEITRMQINEYPKIALNLSGGTPLGCCLVYRDVTLSVTSGGGAWENSKHDVQITDNNTEDHILLRSDYNDVYRDVFRSTLLAYGIMIPEKNPGDCSAYKLNDNLWVRS